MVHLERTQPDLWWKVHHYYCETRRWIADVLVMCELQMHSKFGLNWLQDEWSMLSKGIRGKFALISLKATHGTYLHIPTWWSKTKSHVNLSLATLEENEGSIMAISVSWPKYYWATVERSQACSSYKTAKGFTGTGGLLPRTMDSFSRRENKSLYHKTSSCHLCWWKGEYTVLKTRVCKLMIRVICFCCQ